MNKREKIEKAFLYGVFVCYILFLIKLLFLSRVSLIELFNSQRTLDRTINIIPFNTISEYIFSNSSVEKRFAFGNVIGNIAIFIPLGVYVSIFKNNKKIINNLLLIFTVSLFIEIIQGVLGIGASDIDDITLNCFGGIIGILGYKCLFLILHNDKKVRFTITILSAIGLPILLYLLFIIKLRF